jgi:predicted RND superfamily exporter protein
LKTAKACRESEEKQRFPPRAKLVLTVPGFNHICASLERHFMGAMTGPQILLAFAAAGLALLLVPTSFKFRGFLFLLLTGTGILLGVGLSLGNLTSLFN